MKRKIEYFLRWVLARSFFYKLNKFMYWLSLAGLGILNCDDKISGEYSFLVKLTKSWGVDSVAIDVGANVGNYSNLIKKLSPNTKVYAFEPHPKNFNILENNAKINSYSAFNLGCGKEKSKLKLYDYADNDGSSHASVFKDVIENLHHSNSTAHVVNVIDLDSFLVDQNIKRVNLLKIDVEGNEYSVLEGIHNSIKSGMIEIIQFEFNEMNVVSRTFFRDFYGILCDYRLFRMLADGLIPLGKYNPLFCEIYAFQNIVAIHKNSEFNP